MTARRGLIQASPPARCLTRLRSSPGRRARFKCARGFARAAGCRLGTVAFKVLPGIAISAVKVRLAPWRRIVLFNHIADDFDDFMGTDAYTPAKVLDSIVHAFLASVTDALHGVAANRTYTRSLIAGSHVHRVCSVSKVEPTRKRTSLERTNLVTWWNR